MTTTTQYTEDAIKRETRLPMLRHMAKLMGVAFQATDTVNDLKELIMPQVTKVAPKPAAPKPVAAKPTVAAKPAAPAKPAPVAAKAAPPKPAAPVAAKPTPPKPVAAKPAAAPPEEKYVTLTEFEAFSATLTEMYESFNARVTQLEANAQGYGQFVSIDAEGGVELLIDEADEETLRNWSWQLSIGDMNAEDPETIRAALTKTRKNPKFAGWNFENALPRPEAGAAPEAPAEEEFLTREAIEAANQTQLMEIATMMELDVSKKPTPKVLRNMCLEAFDAASKEGWESVAEGTAVIFTDGNDQYAGTYHGLDADGDCILQLEGMDEQGAYPAAQVGLAG